jgi:hypothetical protein
MGYLVFIFRTTCRFFTGLLDIKKQASQKIFNHIIKGHCTTAHAWKISREFPFKGTVSRDFLLQVFFNESPSPKPLKITLGSFQIFINSRRYSQVKVHHRYQRPWLQILPPVPLVLLTPVTNLPLVSTTLVANCYQVRWDWGQIMGPISGCRLLKVNLKTKIYICINSSTQRCPNKIIKIFLIEDFFHLPLVSLTPVVHFELRISPRSFKKIWNGPKGILRGLGETDSWKKPEGENLVALSL